MALFTPKCLVKAVFIVSGLSFVLMNISFLLRDDDVVITDENETLVLPQSRSRGPSNISSSDGKYEQRFENNQTLVESRYHWRRNESQLPRNLDGNLTLIKEVIQEANRRQTIFNLDRFDLEASEAIVIVVQVHNRPQYLRHLISSLRQATDIGQTLLIFSHDFYSDELNDIVAGIDFCPYLQIFYPYSMQLYPNVFPGEDPRDCPRNINRDEAMKLGCMNKDSPDKYGHYREAKYAQTKHHWFWKINHAFDHLDVTRNFIGPLLFIEEDHYLVADFIRVLRMMYRLKSRACHDCNIITLGTYDKKPTYGDNSPKVDIMTFVSSKHNMGMSLIRDTWKAIKNCSVAFCRFDDYNWDWSLHYIGMSCTQSRLRVMIMKAPRIYHIGEW